MSVFQSLPGLPVGKSMGNVNFCDSSPHHLNQVPNTVRHSNFTIPSYSSELFYGWDRFVKKSSCIWEEFLHFHLELIRPALDSFNSLLRSCRYELALPCGQDCM